MTSIMELFRIKYVDRQNVRDQILRNAKGKKRVFLP